MKRGVRTSFFLFSVNSITCAGVAPTCPASRINTLRKLTTTDPRRDTERKDWRGADMAVDNKGMAGVGSSRLTEEVGGKKTRGTDGRHEDGRKIYPFGRLIDLGVTPGALMRAGFDRKVPSLSSQALSTTTARF